MDAPALTDISLHADRTRAALVHAARLPWLASPEAGVERRMLERIGGEVALASSIVRYQPGSRFSSHVHEWGEEFLVLEGTFSDERGDHGVGTYVRNPPGSRHAPFSVEGCVIFVKLRQMRASDTEHVLVRPGDRVWQTCGTPGHTRALLYAQAGETVSLERLAAGVSLPACSAPGGVEILVVEGSLRVQFGPPSDAHETLEAWSWLRHPDEAPPGFISETGALLWVKRGHLARDAAAGDNGPHAHLR